MAQLVTSLVITYIDYSN